MNITSAKVTARKILMRLIQEEGYTQMEIYQKLQLLEFPVSRASLSNIWNEKPGMSLPLLVKAVRGLQLILERDCCLQYDLQQDTFHKIADCKPRPILPSLNPVDTQDAEIQNSYQIHEGRLDVSQKVDFYKQATYEIIEIGLGLRSFTSYFSSKRESAFYEPIMQKLEQGVDFKCYVIDPNGGFARRYMEDRAVVLPRELQVLEDLQRNIGQLSKLFLQINKRKYKGTIELYRYDHFPYYHASVLDGGTERGRLCISPYLFGLSRANAPVIELDRKHNPVLYRKYWRSIKAITSSTRTVKMV